MKLYEDLTEKERDIVNTMKREGGTIGGLYCNSIANDYLMRHYPTLKWNTAIEKLRKTLRELERHGVLRSSWAGVTYAEAGDISLAKRYKRYTLRGSFVNMSGL